MRSVNKLTDWLNRKKFLNSNTSSTCPDTMVNFRLLTAEICWRVWGTPANFNGFRILAALLHGTLVVGVSQTLWRWTEGATYIRQGGHHVGHWPTFLVASVLQCLMCQEFDWCLVSRLVSALSERSGYVAENFRLRNYVILLCPRILIHILLFLSLFAHKRPCPLFYTYPTKNPHLNR